MKRYLAMALTAIMLAMPITGNAAMIGIRPSGLNKVQLVRNLAKAGVSNDVIAEILSKLK